MACSITLPFWPITSECISWSKDNVIAVVGGESIAILTPRLKEPGADGKNWDTTIIVVNGFTESELPLRSLASNAKLSIGEEISQWVAIRAEWSSPGLTRHRGCALAVLTSNHLLSIWDSDGKFTDNFSWKRRLVVNHALRRHYEEVVDPSGEDADQREERIKVSQRILAFAWSHPLHRSSPSTGEDELKNFLDWGDQFLAVATGCGDIAILRVQSPFSDRSSPWLATVSEVINVGEHWKRTTTDSWGAAIDVPKTGQGESVHFPVADAVAWSDWTRDSSPGEVATIACIMNGRLFTTRLRGVAHQQSTEVGSVQPLVINSLITEHPDLTPGPLEIISDVEPESIIACSPDIVFQIPINREHHVNSHHLDDRWDEITGVAVCRHSSRKYTLHVVSLLSSAKAPTAELNLPLRAGHKAMPSWQYAINELRASYSAEFDLEGNVLDRTYGIRSSPFTNYVATCSAVHPSDALGYFIGSEQTSALNISLEITPLSDQPILAPEVAGKRIPVSTESLIFEAKRRIENSVRFAVDSAPDLQSLADQIRRILPQHSDPEQTRDSVSQPSGTVDALIRIVKLQVLFDSELQESRAELLARFVLNQPINRDEVMRRVVRKLVATVLDLPASSLDMDDLVGLRILRNYENILAIYESRPPTVFADPKFQEQCPICSSAVPLVSVKWASCNNGHNFSRCALTFLSIPGPGTTKSCGICDAMFLHERALHDLVTESRNSHQTSKPRKDDALSAAGKQAGAGADDASYTGKSSLVDILTHACDVCVYCGGRFTD